MMTGCVRPRFATRSRAWIRSAVSARRGLPPANRPVEPTAIELSIRELGVATRKRTSNSMSNGAKPEKSGVSPNEIWPSKNLPPSNEAQPSYSDRVSATRFDRDTYSEGIKGYLDTNLASPEESRGISETGGTCLQSKRDGHPGARP